MVPLVYSKVAPTCIRICYPYPMIIQIGKIGNIVGGFLLSVPALEKIEVIKPYVQKGRKALADYESTIGMIELILGAVMLIERLSSNYYTPYLGSSYPQAIAAIGVGFMLSKDRFGKTDLYKSLEPYSDIIGIAGLALGLTLIF